MIKKILDNNGFLTQLISCRQYNYTNNKFEFFGDGGVDIIAKYKNIMEVNIQCKCLAKKVGPCVIRGINGVRNHLINDEIEKSFVLFQKMDLLIQRLMKQRNIMLF